MVKRTILFLAFSAALVSCNRNPHNNSQYDPVSTDLDSIKKRGKLIAVTDLNSTNYFVYKGEPMGFYYELLKSFSDHLGVDLEIITENRLLNAFELLNSGKADILAIGLTVNASRKKELLFSDPITKTRQVLVQRKPRNWHNLNGDEIDRQLIRNQLDLANKTVYVQEGSSHIERLSSLASEIGEPINIIQVPYGTEQLIRNVANGEIDLTVSDENIAYVNCGYYSDIDISTPVSFVQNIAWGLRKNNTEKLQQELNSWIRTLKATSYYDLLYAKYFRNSRSAIIVNSDYYTLNSGKVSQWDNLIKNASRKINWDWRLLASLIYQESRFNPKVQSKAGAYGLMQIMPSTGKRFGIDINSSPESNIMAGTMYIDWLHTIYDNKIPDENERIKFILASYNAGPGHILDAMKLAEKNGKDPARWEGNVAVWLLKKAEPQYFNDTVVKNGYFRGKESVRFVNDVLERYEHYRNLLPPGEIASLKVNKGTY